MKPVNTLALTFQEKYVVIYNIKPNIKTKRISPERRMNLKHCGKAPESDEISKPTMTS